MQLLSPIAPGTCIPILVWAGPAKGWQIKRYGEEEFSTLSNGTLVQIVFLPYRIHLFMPGWATEGELVHTINTVEMLKAEYGPRIDPSLVQKILKQKRKSAETGILEEADMVYERFEADEFYDERDETNSVF